MVKTEAPPRWRCTECGRVYDGGGIDPRLANIDDVADVFSKGRNRGENRCPECGGTLELI